MQHFFRFFTLLCLLFVFVPILAQPSRVAQLFEARQWVASTSVGNLAFFAGGRDSANVDRSWVEIFSNYYLWGSGTLSVPRSQIAAMTIEDELAIFALGLDALGQVDYYDARNFMWSSTLINPARRQVVGTAVGKRAIVAGGQEGAYQWFNIYDRSSHSWTSRNNPRPRTDLAATSVGEFALIAGGRTYSASPNIVSDRVDIYNVNTDFWNDATLSQARSHLTATTVGRFAIFAGGAPNPSDLYEVSDRVDIFDFTSRTWTTATLSQARRDLAATSYGNYALFGGGRTQDGSASAVVDIFDISTNTWFTASLSEARYLLTATTAGVFAYFAGGNRGSGVDNVTATIDIFKFCRSNEECDDGEYCNGVEVCDVWCRPSVNPCQNNGYCLSYCNEQFDRCETPPNPDCDDGKYCNGIETCINGECVSSGDPCGNNTYCASLCDEDNDNCFGLNNTSCDDGWFCNGEDTCVNGVCVSPGNPCIGNKDWCAQACDEENDNCWLRNNSSCDDEEFCNGVETCVNGVCKSSGDPCAAIMCYRNCFESGKTCQQDIGLCINDQNQTGSCLQGACIVLQTTTSSTSASAMTTTTTTSSSISTDVQPPNNVNGEPSESADNMVIIISSVAGVVVVVLVILVVLFVWLRKRKQRPEDDELAMQTKSSEPDPDIYLTDVVIKERLGSGNFGDVYKGLWQGTTEVALKSLSGSDNPEVFMNEAKLLQSLNHANIVRCYGLHIAEKKLYIVMEFVPYGSVNTYLQKQQDNLSVTALLDICVQTAAGMKYLESKKVVHRDLAARNLLAAHGDKDHAITVRISDFGMSRKLEKTYYTIQGTKELPIKWSAPEVFNFGTWSNKSDVWAFGITMWEIFSYGAIPYPSMSNQQTVEEVEKGYRMPAPNECPPEVHKVMLKCWEKDPTERPTFEELFNTLKDMIEKGQSDNLDSDAPQHVKNGGGMYERTPNVDDDDDEKPQESAQYSLSPNI